MQIEFETQAVKSARKLILFFGMLSSITADAVPQSSIGYFDFAVPCTLLVGQVPIGGGVVLGSSKKQINPLLVTARHTVTYNRNYLNKINVSTAGGIRFPLGPSRRLWYTVKRKSVDTAWLFLNADQEQTISRADRKLQIAISTAIQMKEGDETLIANGVDIYKAPYLSSSWIDCPFPSNICLTKVTLYVDIVKKSVPVTVSGSPVFSRNGGVYFLLGNVSISRANPNATGYINIREYLSNIIMSMEKRNGVKLEDCPELW